MNVTTGESYLRVDPTAYDLKLFRNPSMFTTNTFAVANNATVYSDYYTVPPNCHWYITSIVKGEVCAAGWSWYEITDGAISINSHNVAHTAATYPSAIYGALGTTAPIILKPGERLRVACRNTSGAGVNASYIIRYVEVFF